VAKVGEAEAMLAAGVRDLLVAYPIFGEAKLQRLQRVAEQAERLIVSLDDVAVADGLARVGRKLGRALSVYVEVDCGLARMGRPPGVMSADVARQIARLDGAEVVGLMTHAGHAYQARGRDALRQVALQEAEAVVDAARVLEQQGIRVRELSIGSTPTAHFIEEVVTTFGVTEIRPGTYVFNDVNQIALGTAEEADCALTVLATVVSRPAADRMVIDAGSKTLGADAGVAPGYGRLKGHPDAVVQRLWEEHGVVSIDASAAWRVGDHVEVIPNHACIPPNLTDELIGTRNGVVERRIAVEGRGKNR
jgi:D-serine deaminase-like pyridoxal phosphate-dependent protein